MNDNESGLYYLQSRYYDPKICRFINADSYISTGQGFLGSNMFAYCNNNAVNLADVSGSRSQVCIDDQFNPIRMPWQDGPTGGKSAYSLIIYPPNPNPWLTPVELIDDATATGKIVSGTINVFTGVSILFIPDPIPVADEVKAVVNVGKGLVQIIAGLLKLAGVNISLGGT